jgi:hypothetical protein
MPATINRAMQDLTKFKNPQFAPWVPSGFKVGINSPPMRTPAHWPTKDMSRSLTCVINNTVINEKLKQIVRNYRLIREMNGYDVWTNVGGNLQRFCYFLNIFFFENEKVDTKQKYISRSNF